MSTGPATPTPTPTPAPTPTPPPLVPAPIRLSQNAAGATIGIGISIQDPYLDLWWDFDPGTLAFVAETSLKQRILTLAAMTDPGYGSIWQGTPSLPPGSYFVYVHDMGIGLLAGSGGNVANPPVRDVYPFDVRAGGDDTQAFAKVVVQEMGAYLATASSQVLAQASARLKAQAGG